ncbi:hypothetical protein [Microvirga soli]|uniref:hypothetical protein n=1 Tax=Microvirga soli TaxID=1854496 RepID=UPI00191F2B8E|nr:hypothetical protein [Microvirga soli]
MPLLSLRSMLTRGAKWQFRLFARIDHWTALGSALEQRLQYLVYLSGLLRCSVISVACRSVRHAGLRQRIDKLAFPQDASAKALAGLALLAVCGDQCLAQGRDARTLYIAPVPAGSEDGSNWSNAGALNRLPEFIAKLASGGSILLKADAGPYRVDRQISIRNGGSEGAQVTIYGADGNGNPSNAEILGSRADPWLQGAHPGPEVFRLQTGADYLVFRNLSFRNTGNGCFRVAGSIRGLGIEDVSAQNVRRFFEVNPSGEEQSARVNDLTIRRVAVRGYSKGAFRIRGDSSNVTMEDIIGDSERQDGDNFAIGVALEDTVHDVVLRRVTMMNSHDSSNAYWNGDGFTTESRVRNVRFEDTVASGSTDGGYDLKSTETTLRRTVADDNKRNYRIWGDATIVDCVSRSPHKRGGSGLQNHFWIAKSARADVSGCEIQDSDERTTVFEVEHGGSIVVKNTSIKTSPSGRLSLVREGGHLQITPRQ